MNRVDVAVMDSGGQAANVIGSEPGLHLVAIAADVADFQRKLEHSGAGVAVIDTACTTDSDQLVDLVTALGARGCAAIVVGTGTDAALLSRAVMAGARAFLIKPYGAEELIAAVRTVTSRSPESRRARVRSDDEGMVIAVYGPKGGSGTTTIATGVAAALASTKGKRVALVDLDLQFGDVGIALDLRSANTVTDLLAHPGQIDRAIVDDIFVQHRSGIRALLAPETLALAKTVDPEALTRMIDQLREHFDHIVCDVASNWDDVSAAVLEAADRVILVTTPELAALKDVQRSVVAAPALRVDERVRLVVNRWPGKAGVDVPEIERALGRRVALTIGSDGAAVTQALNSGLSVLDPTARVRVAKSYRDLADLVNSGRNDAAGAA